MQMRLKFGYFHVSVSLCFICSTIKFDDFMFRYNVKRNVAVEAIGKEKPDAATPSKF